MAWSVMEDLGAFDIVARPFLEAAPVERTVLLTILAVLQRGLSFSEAPPVFAVHPEGAALQTPPRPLLIAGSADPEGLAAVLADRPLTGVNALTPVAHAFAGAWAAAHEVPVRETLRQHLLELERLIPPPAPARGQVRPATPADDDAVFAMAEAFADELDVPGQSRDLVVGRLGSVWEVDGQVVAYAGSPPAVAGVGRVGPVYTQPGHRGHGYGAAVTAHVTQAALDAGAQRMCLFTDAANPTANALYERLGYRRRPDGHLILDFG